MNVHVYSCIMLSNSKRHHATMNLCSVFQLGLYLYIIFVPSCSRVFGTTLRVPQSTVPSAPTLIFIGILVTAGWNTRQRSSNVFHLSRGNEEKSVWKRFDLFASSSLMKHLYRRMGLARITHRLAHCRDEKSSHRKALDRYIRTTLFFNLWSTSK